MEVKIVLNGGMMPKKEFADSAGYDLFIPCNTKVKRGRQVIKLGFSVALPKNIGMFIFSRSGVEVKGVDGYYVLGEESSKNRMDCNIKLGLVDCGYTGEVGLIVDNHDQEFWLTENQSVSQAVFVNTEIVDFAKVERLDETERGNQGFNS